MQTYITPVKLKQINSNLPELVLNVIRLKEHLYILLGSVTNLRYSGGR